MSVPAGSRRWLLVGVVLIALVGGATSDVARGAVPQAKLKWRIADRYERSWQHWDQSRSLYVGNFMAAKTTEATFDLCGSVAPAPITRYSLTLKAVGSSFRAASTGSKCVVRFKNPPVLDGQVLPCPGCAGPELPFGVYEVTYAVATGRGFEFGPATTERIELRDYLIVSLGDSLASGEGSPDVNGDYEFTFGDGLDLVLDNRVKVTEKRPVKWKDRRCHRSGRSGHALLAQRLEDRDPHSSVTFISLACSGAEVDKGVLGTYAGMEPQPGSSDLPAQVEVLRSLIRDGNGQRRIDSILLQVGINDLDFSDIIVACAGNRDVNAGSAHCMYDTGFSTKLTALRTRFERLGTTINRLFPRTEVYVADYPGDVFKGGGCGLLGIPLHGITDVEGQAMSAGGLQLNAELQRLAWKYDWNYIGGVTEAFSPHAYCASSRWFNRIEESFHRQGNREGTAHPNHRGHEAFRDALAPAVVLAPKTSPSYRVQLTIQRVRLGSVPGRDDWTNFDVKVQSRGDSLFTESRRFKVAKRGALLVPDQGPLRYTRLIYEGPQPPRQLKHLSFVLSGVGGTVPVLHKPDESFKPSCVSSAAGPCHITRTPKGSYLATTPNGNIAVEYSLSIRPINPATELPDPANPPKAAK